ncbi:MAG TPA: TMEM165/GDT1 family protein [Mycobacterium sp.]|jgi:putative Ca2+/H+ antiporter (TMEM165/GDT1 family)
MLTAALISLGVVFVAELGDKSQLITMTYALRHRWWVVLSGVAIAAFLIHGLSVLIGHFLGLSLPERPIAFAAAVAFFVFAGWTWRERRDDCSPPPAPEHRFVLLAVISSYVLAELGDKTMLATVALASERNWAGVWLGATVAMVLADGLAIAVGALLHRRLPERLLHAVSGGLFFLIGLWLLFDSALGWRVVAIAVTASAAAVLVGAMVVARRRRTRAFAKRSD